MHYRMFSSIPALYSLAASVRHNSAFRLSLNCVPSVRHNGAFRLSLNCVPSVRHNSAFPLSLNCVPSVRHNYATTAILWTERRDED